MFFCPSPSPSLWTYFISRMSSSPTGTCVLPYLNALVMSCHYEPAKITRHNGNS